MDFKNFLTPKGFLSLGGFILVLLGVLGYVGVLGQTPDQSLFGVSLWFDSAENFTFTVLGVVALLAVYKVKDATINKFLVLAVAALALVVGLYSLMGEVTVLGANLESPGDTVLHLVVGVWGLLAGLKGKA